MNPTSISNVMIKNLPKKSGKTLEDWIIILKPHNFSKHGEIIKYLKQECSLTQSYINMIAFRHREKL